MINIDEIKNTIICGDCLEVMKQLPDKCVDLVLTDPPYGINYQSARRTDKSLWKPKIANDEAPFVAWVAGAFRILKDSGRLLCFYRWDVQDLFLFELKSAGFAVKSQIIWDKIIHGMGDLSGEFSPQHENILYATKGRYSFTVKRPSSVMQCQRVLAESLVHPNEKPVQLINRLICSLTQKDDTILDPFLGSGTTAVACYRTRRNYIGIEISPEYCKIAEKRIQEEKNKLALFNGLENV